MYGSFITIDSIRNNESVQINGVVTFQSISEQNTTDYRSILCILKYDNTLIEHEFNLSPLVWKVQILKKKLKH